MLSPPANQLLVLYISETCFFLSHIWRIFKGMFRYRVTTNANGFLQF